MSYESLLLDANLVSHVNLDDNAASTTVVADVGSNGTLNGGENTSAKYVGAGNGPSVLPDYGFLFNGTDDWVDIPHYTADDHSMSMAAWVRWPSSSAAIGIAFAQCNVNGGGNNNAIKAGGLNASGQGYIYDRDDGAGGTVDGNTTGTFDDGSWHHLAVVTYGSSTDGILYVNGSNLATVPYKTGTFSSDGISLGAVIRNGSDIWFAPAEVADFWYFDRSLTSGEINEIYAGPQGPGGGGSKILILDPDRINFI